MHIKKEKKDQSPLLMSISTSQAENPQAVTPIFKRTLEKETQQLGVLQVSCVCLCFVSARALWANDPNLEMSVYQYMYLGVLWSLITHD